MNNGQQTNWRTVPGMPGISVGTSDAQFDKAIDPTKGIGGMPPNLGQYAVPHVTTFMGLLSNVAKVYRPSDEAIRDSYENARIMRNDVTVMECVEMRQRAVALLDWSIEPEDAKNSEHVAFCDALEKIVRKIPRFMQYQENLLHATWYGKYAIQHKWSKKLIENKMRSVPAGWLPINGDKIVFRFDDGTGDYRPDQIGLRITGALTGLTPQQHQKVETTDRGLAYFFDTWERSLLALHKYRIEDGEWEEPSNAGRIHGVGVRSVIYWTWYQKQETLAYLMEYLERSAGGVELWYYPMSNPQAEQATRTAAEQRQANGRNIILVPRPEGDQAGLYGVERFEAGMAGADALKSIITEYFGHAIKRYILGQTLTTEASATGLGSNLADIHMDTFMQIVRYDAMLLEETLDTDLLAPLVAYNFPDMIHVPIHFRKNLSEPDSESLLEGLSKAYEMGLAIKGETVRDIVGAPKPEEGDEILDKMAQMQQEQQAAMQQAQAMGVGAGQMGQGQPPEAEQEQAPPTSTAPAEATGPAEYMASAVPSENSDRKRLIDNGAPVEQYRKWSEEDHPRDDDGKFAVAAGIRAAQSKSHRDTPAAEPPSSEDWEPLKSPKFRRWFGDSKIVDADGEPRIVYHGTGEKFEAFDNSRLGENTSAGNTALGHFFTSDDYQADGAYAGSRGVVLETYLKIEKPLHLGGGDFDSDASGAINRAAGEFHNKDSGDLTAEEWEEYRDFLTRHYDGIIVDLYWDGKKTGHQNYVVFNPNQVKSAFDNSGEFDPDDDRIDYAAGWSETDHKRANDGKFAPLDLTGWDKPVVQPPSLKGQQSLFDDVDPSQVGSTPAKPTKPKRNPNQRELFSRNARIAQAIRQRRRPVGA